MLFDTISESTLNTNWDEIEPSKYEANLEGALMLVYENECNYNALMRAAGLSELKYYQETGGDLFVQEAGAFGGFLTKAKEFFKKVLEKIKALFKKFFMTINQFFMSDKQWVHKYEKDILRATNIKDMEFKGYTFKNLENNANTIKSAVHKLYAEFGATVIGYVRDSGKGYAPVNDSDKLSDMKEENRAELVGENGKIDESEFREKLKELFYGDTEKEVLDDSDINLREQLQHIKDTKNDVRVAEKFEKDITKGINDLIKNLDQIIKNDLKFTSDERTDKDLSEDRSNGVTSINETISIAKSFSNDVTIACGIFCQALKDRNRQAKAICIKAVSYNSKKKNESAVYSDPDDLFAGVTIR